jgi:uncharacterized protein YcaQ
MLRHFSPRFSILSFLPLKNFILTKWNLKEVENIKSIKVAEISKLKVHRKYSTLDQSRSEVSTISKHEISKFGKMARNWWNSQGILIYLKKLFQRNELFS